MLWNLSGSKAWSGFFNPNFTSIEILTTIVVVFIKIFCDRQIFGTIMDDTMIVPLMLYRVYVMKPKRSRSLTAPCQIFADRKKPWQKFDDRQIYWRFRSWCNLGLKIELVHIGVILSSFQMVAFWNMKNDELIPWWITHVI